MTLKIKDPGSALTHFIAMILALGASSPLIIKAARTPGYTHVLPLAIFITSMILLYAASTIYHTLDISPTVNQILRKVDHMMIFILIAGTYTPFLLVGLDSPLARGLMIVIWSLALLGILFKLTIAHRFKILSLVTYLAMGWLSLVVIYEMAVKLAAGSVTLLAVGGVVYSLGVIFYVCKRIPYNHAIWHGFVLGGSVCHFLAIYLYIGQA